MKLLRRDTDAALKALLIMAKEREKRFTATYLAGQMLVSRPFLRKILQLLQKQGFLQSSKGKGGGFWLSQEPDRIRLFDVIEAFQGPVELQECLFRPQLCPDLATCVLRKKILRLEASLAAELENLTLEDLLQENRKGVLPAGS